MKRKQIPSKIRLKMFFNANKQCQSCQSVIHPGQKWEIDHIIPLAIGGPDTIENMQILCKICHRFKTDNQDISQIAKVKRLEIIHFGAKKSSKRPIMGSKSSALKKKLDGTILIREPKK